MKMVPLHTLGKNISARIEHLRLNEELRENLMRLGLMEGLDVRVLHEGPFGRDPIAIAIDTDGRTISLRRSDAANVLVSVNERTA